MKNLYRKGIMVVVAIILSTAFLNAQSDHRVSNIPFSQLFSSGIYDNVVVNKTGHTGSQIKSLITEWARRNGHKMTDPGMMLFPLNYPHMNTSADKKRLNPYWDDSPRGMGWGWDKPLWKDTCTNLCAFSENDKAALVQLLNEFAINKGNFTPTDDGSSSSDNSTDNQTNKNDMKPQILNQYINNLPAGSTPVSGSEPFPLWATILIIVLSALLIGFLAYLFRPVPAAAPVIVPPVTTFVNQLRDGWAVEDEVTRRNDQRVRNADAFQSERNTNFHTESNLLHTRYGGNANGNNNPQQNPMVVHQNGTITNNYPVAPATNAPGA